MLRVYNLQMDDDKQFRVAGLWLSLGMDYSGDERTKISDNFSTTKHITNFQCPPDTLDRQTDRQTNIVDRPCRIQFANILRRFIATKHKHIGPLTRVDMLLIRYIVEALI